MRIHLLILVYLSLALFTAYSQDAGFKLPGADERKSTETNNSGNTGASLINNMEQLDNTYSLRTGDRVSFRIVEERLPPESMRIMDSGDILAKHVGPVRALGRTCRDVAYQIKSLLEKSVFVKATVIIVLDETRKSQGGLNGNLEESEVFTVFGQVLKQGKYELRFDQDVTISQALLIAGGPAQFANLKKVRVLRRIPNSQAKTIQVDVQSIMAGGRLERDIFIRSGDVIIVPEKGATF
jgi:protein involved in polysaccharide export with SLBB domain